MHNAYEAILIMGDFNEIVSPNEKMWGPPRPYKQMDDFKMVLSSCGLQDLGFRGVSIHLEKRET